MTNPVTQRSEILFCYDITDANPNGDPLDENKPRIDEETKINIVTDVRLKRTIRDYLYEHKGYNGTNGKDIFVREINLDGGSIQDGKTRAEDFLIVDTLKIKKNQIKEKFFTGNVSDKELVQKMTELIQKEMTSTCIDARMFGCTLPVEFNDKNKSSVTLTGPVQFKMGRSLHQVELRHIQGTGAFASKEGANQKTFREEYQLPYSFIAFHGIVNEKAAAHTGLTEEDIAELMQGIWHGTKNLISRSKFGQMPRLLLKVTYKESGFFIGDLDKRISITGCENELKIRSLKDFKLDTTELIKVLELNKDRIEKIEMVKDQYLTLTNEISNATVLKI